MNSAHNVLVTTYHEAFLNKGGGEFELLEITLNLRKLGILADVYGPYSRSVHAYDTVLHFSMHNGGLELLTQLKRAGKRIIIWPNLWLEQAEVERIAPSIRNFASLADIITYKSLAERDFLAEVIPLNSCRTLYVSNCVDPVYAQPAPRNLFQTTFNLDKYILWVGIIEPQKNQLRAITALKSLDIPVVFIGNYRDAAYYNQCREAASSHMIFLEAMPHKSDLLRSAIQDCAVYLEVSTDPPGKSILEAGVAGASVVTNDSAWTREHFGEDATYVDALSEKSIFAGVVSTLANPSKPRCAERLKERHCLPKVLAPLVNCIQEPFTSQGPSAV